ncbi:MAG: DUF1080 domain-containing protein [Anaerolineales bacterium]|nr:DUF1080 domain-containing protein [Anaerolineales bacterium]
MRYKPYILFLFLFGTLLIVSLACGFQTAANTPIPAPPAQVMDTPAPPPAPTVAPPTEPVTQRFFTEEFDSGMDNWSHFLTHGDENNFDLITKNGRLIFDLQGEYIYSYVTYDPEIYDDVRIDVEVNNRGFNNNNVSLICRYDENEGWYEFNIANNGLYEILYGSWDSNGKTASYTRITNGGSNKIKAGKETNQYSVICKGRRLSLYINGVETNSIEDNRFVLREGKVAISVSSFNVYPINVEYEWVKISAP